MNQAVLLGTSRKDSEAQRGQETARLTRMLSSLELHACASYSTAFIAKLVFLRMVAPEFVSLLPKKDTRASSLELLGIKLL